MKKKYDSKSNECLKTILTVAQYFGSFPVTNLRNSDPKKLGFSWHSIPIIYSIILSSLYLVVGVTALFKVFSYGSVLNQLSTNLK